MKIKKVMGAILIGLISLQLSAQTHRDSLPKDQLVPGISTGMSAVSMGDFTSDNGTGIFQETSIGVIWKVNDFMFMDLNFMAGFQVDDPAKDELAKIQKWTRLGFYAPTLQAGQGEVVVRVGAGYAWERDQKSPYLETGMGFRIFVNELSFIEMTFGYTTLNGGQLYVPLTFRYFPFK